MQYMLHSMHTMTFFTSELNIKRLTNYYILERVTFTIQTFSWSTRRYLHQILSNNSIVWSYVQTQVDFLQLIFYVWGIKLLIHHFGKWCCWCYSSGKWLYFWAKFCALYLSLYNGDFKIAMRKSIGLVYALCPQKAKIVHTLCNINEKWCQFKFCPHISSNWI